MWWHETLSGDVFDTMMGVVIIMNAVVVAIQVDTDARRRYRSIPRENIWDVLEVLFVLLSTGELALRCFVYRLAAFKNSWVRFDTVLVVLSWAELIAKGINRLGNSDIADGIVNMAVHSTQGQRGGEQQWQN